jgi:phospholipid-binding lipoprotein MlaA
MRLSAKSVVVPIACLLAACSSMKGNNPIDPYEPINREIHKFNMAFDATMLKPPAKFYKAAVPPPVRNSINNAYNNVNMLPTIANDILQWEWNHAIKDTWRFVLNSTFGIAGLFDPATSNFGLPPHSNDMGQTFAKWGDKKSPYVVIPFLGPSTIRDGFGMMFDFSIFTPYPYLPNDKVIYSLVVLRYIDLRSQMLETDHLIAEAIDPYTFIRDAYLQRREFLIHGTKPDSLGSLYVDDDDADSFMNETPADGTPSEFPITTAKNASHSPPSA